MKLWKSRRGEKAGRVAAAVALALLASTTAGVQWGSVVARETAGGGAVPGVGPGSVWPTESRQDVVHVGGGRLAVVRTTDGVVYEGEVREEGLMVIVRDRRGIESRIPRERVASIRYREETELEFLRRYRELLPGDVDERVKLAQFAMAERRADLARRVLLEALEQDPNHLEAQRLYDVVRGQLELERRQAEAEARGAAPPAPPARPGAGAGGSDRPGGAGEAGAAERGGNGRGSGDGAAGDVAAGNGATGRAGRELLSPEQINRVRQVEIRLGETNLPLRFENDVERRFATRTGVTLASLRQRTPLERFMLMRESNDAELLADVRVLRDPASLLEYRNRIQPRVLSGCATSGCHGGNEGAGDLRLFSPATSEAEAYTNFYILATRSYPVRGADGRMVQRRMIDRVSPELSLLLQFMLPADVARFPHPAVRGFRPMFRSPDAEGFRQVLNWVGNALTPLDPDYGFEFPGGGPAGGAGGAGGPAGAGGDGGAKAEPPSTRPTNPATPPGGS
ncbi:MAG: tetratricopeptide repeat protein [Tepidisphaerales bacterium]